MPAPVTLSPIGVVHSPVSEIVDDVFGDLIAHIEIDASRFTPDSLAGLHEFSHVEVVFIFNRLADSDIFYGARRPRGRADWPLVGILAQRGKNRPNRIGVTVCRLLKVDGLTLEVEGLDAIDGTPVLDIKPYMPEFAPRGEVRRPQWAAELMARYWGSSR